MFFLNLMYHRSCSPINQITSMYRCATIQGLDTAEGLFLFGKEHFYVVDGVTLLSTKEIKDIDSLPQGYVPHLNYIRVFSTLCKNH